MTLLETKQLTRTFGGVIAVNKVDFQVEEGLITGIIGPNGAGKTTLFNNITGLDFPTSGQVYFEGKEITGTKANKVCKLGIARTFQNIRLFRELSVLENVMIGRHCRIGQHKSHFANAIDSYFKMGDEQERIFESSMRWIKFMELEGLENELSKNLPYGHQRELEIARALATEPKLIFLDEPAAGMNPQETDHLMMEIRKIRDLGITIVLIEHDMKLVMNICDNITVLSYGLKIAQGTPNEIQQNSAVIEAYLGKEEDDDE